MGWCQGCCCCIAPSCGGAGAAQPEHTRDPALTVLSTAPCPDLLLTGWCSCRTPFADLPFVPKMHAICNPHHRVSFPELANKDLLDVMRRCLDRDPKSRITLQVTGQGLLQLLLLHDTAAVFGASRQQCSMVWHMHVAPPHQTQSKACCLYVCRSCWITPSCTPTGSHSSRQQRLPRFCLRSR